MVHTENQEPGEAWIQIHPDYTGLYDEMVTYAEAHLADRADGVGYVRLYVNEGCELESIAIARGYKKLESKRSTYLECTLDEIAPPELPEGFIIKSVADEDDVEKRRMARAMSFDPTYCPSEWLPASVFEEMQQAPDYRKDLDLFIVASNGEVAAFCTIWLDERNQYGVFEPMGTHTDYQRRGLGRALLLEGLRRMAQCGATRSFMDSGNPFYRKVGFEPTAYSYCPWIKYFEVRL